MSGVRESNQRHLTYLSLGAGVQSSALYVLSTLGKAPRADVAIFADTQDEPVYVYEQLGRLMTWGYSHGGPLVSIITRGRLSEAQRAGGRSFIPLFVRNPDGSRGFLRRKCTREFKVEPIERHVRTLLGFKKGERVSGRATATALIGISRDEIQRMKPARLSWIKHEFPLVDLNLRRSDCQRVVESVGLPTPLKSACGFCPFKDNDSWMWLKKHHPQEFERACVLDDSVRNSTASGIKNAAFIHSSLKPLREVDLEDKQGDLFDGFQNECEGMCGV